MLNWEFIQNTFHEQYEYMSTVEARLKSLKPRSGYIIQRLKKYLKWKDKTEKNLSVTSKNQYKTNDFCIVFDIQSCDDNGK